ncbi:MAG: DUF362 domain-containing protein [Anaerolineae bacterium]|nr:DUF362 domain-containing protein [Thermoflexales bacterium]MDW8408619.1 DUF362 domain-containing protein [Anaerolineae bacterium]
MSGRPIGRAVSRRTFLHVAGGVLAAGMTSGGCQSLPDSAPAQTPAVSELARAVTPRLIANRPVVAVAQAMNYEPSQVRKTVRELIDQTGGLRGVVKSGDRVAIKVNLTGGVKVRPLPGVAPVDSYVTHPNVVRPLIEAVKEAGARDVTLVEAVYENASWKEWGYEDLAAELDVKLLDLNMTDPYPDYAQVNVGEGAFIYSDFTFNHILEECDVFISVPKMKCHYSAGVTLSMKNLVGLVPARFYRLSAQHNHRSALHGHDDEVGSRLPRVIVDLNRARPIRYALIDGVKTTDGGEGPWISTMAPVDAHLLVAGMNPLATDAVATALMGFDPTAAPMTMPFVRSDNHLALAAQMGFGTIQLNEIELRGAPIDAVKVAFKPA